MMSWFSEKRKWQQDHSSEDNKAMNVPLLAHVFAAGVWTTEDGKGASN